jgi:hypothetical protein
MANGKRFFPLCVLATCAFCGEKLYFEAANYADADRTQYCCPQHKKDRQRAVRRGEMKAIVDETILVRKRVKALEHYYRQKQIEKEENLGEDVGSKKLSSIPSPTDYENKLWGR